LLLGGVGHGWMGADEATGVGGTVWSDPVGVAASASAPAALLSPSPSDSAAIAFPIPSRSLSLVSAILTAYSPCDVVGRDFLWQ